MERRRNTTLTALALAAALTFAGAGQSQDAPPPEVPRLDTAEIEPFLGEWVLEAITDRGSLNSLITFSDDEGKAIADFYLAQLADLTIDRISLTETGVLLLFEVELADQLIPVELNLAREGDELVGDLSAAFFEATIKGTTKEAAEAAGIVIERQEVGPPEDLSSSRIEIAGQAVRLRFDLLPAPGPDYDRLEGLADGAVLGPVYGKPFKFWTDADLAFEDAKIAAHNHGPTYPGVYSLWLKREGDGWKLVFNHLADVWGTMHMAEHDAAETPLNVRTLDEAVEETEGRLEMDGNGGMLTLRWGKMEWSAPFRVVE